MTAAALVFNSAPKSGPPGSVINASSVDPCPLPAGPPPPPYYVQLFLNQGSTVAATSQPFQDHPLTAWNASITVPTNVASGSYTVTAACFSSAGQYASYQPNAFTVSPPPSPTPAASPSASPQPSPTPSPTPVATPTANPRATPPSSTHTGGGQPPGPAPNPLNGAPHPTSPEFALVITVEPAQAMAGVSDLRTALATRTGVDFEATPAGWTARLGSRAIESWPERVAITDGVYLDLLRITLDGQPIANNATFPTTGRHVLELVVTPAYRINVQSSYADVFGSGVYRYGALARIGVLNERTRMDGPLGLLGGDREFSGWDGLGTDQRVALFNVTQLRTVKARWRDNVTIPAAFFAGIALMLLLVTTPGRIQQTPLMGSDVSVAITKQSFGS